MLSIPDIIEKIVTKTTVMPPELIDVRFGLGRVLSHDVVATFPLPYRDVSNINGYAARAQDIQEVPTDLDIIGKSHPSDVYNEELEEKQAIYIWEGVPMPPGANVVIPEHLVTRNNKSITVTKLLLEGQNVSMTGIDVDKNDTVFNKGVTLDSNKIALISAMRLPWISVQRKPRVGCMASATQGVFIEGNHNVSHDGAAMITAISSCIDAMGGVPISFGLALDVSAPVDHILAFKASVNQALEGVDMLVTVGGVTYPDDTIMWPALSQQGAVLEQYGVAIGDGATVVVGKRNNIPIVGLPDNLSYALMCSTIFVEPAIRSMQGIDPESHKEVYGILNRDLDEVDKKVRYLCATGEWDESGTLQITPFSAQDPLMLTAMCRANYLVDVDLSKPLKRGTSVRALPMFR